MLENSKREQELLHELEILQKRVAELETAQSFGCDEFKWQRFIGEDLPPVSIIILTGKRRMRHIRQTGRCGFKGISMSVRGNGGR